MVAASAAVMSVRMFVIRIVEYGIEGSMCKMRWDECLTNEIVRQCLHLYICAAKPRAFNQPLL